MTRPPRTLLINPTIASRHSARFPRPLLNQAAALDHHGESRILDGNIERDTVPEVLRALDHESFDAVGMTVMGGPHVPEAIKLSRAIREHSPDLPIIWGSYFPTLFTDAALNAPYVDYAVRGQGEETLVELVSALTGHGPPLGAIAGLSWKDNGRIVHNPARRFSRGNPPPLLP